MSNNCPNSSISRLAYAHVHGDEKGYRVAGGAIALAVAGYGIVIKYLRNKHKSNAKNAAPEASAHLHQYAATLGDDPEFKTWASNTREVAAKGLAPDQRVEKEELLQLKALRKSS
jgi:hypothetical protein